MRCEVFENFIDFTPFVMLCGIIQVSRLDNEYVDLK